MKLFRICAPDEEAWMTLTLLEHRLEFLAGWFRKRGRGATHDSRDETERSESSLLVTRGWGVRRATRRASEMNERINITVEIQAGVSEISERVRVWLVLHYIHDS